jgi:hypothetical protein
MQIFVKNWTGHVITLNVDSSETIRSVMAKILSHQKESDAFRPRLLFDNKFLKAMTL